MDGNRSNYSERDPGPVPDRWLLCPRTSQSFILDRFLAFKTPLNFRFASKLAKEHQFQPEMVFSWMKIYKKKLGLWIDLTNTNRFYDRKEIDTRDCRYTKLQCRGHGETPSAEQRQSFFNIVDEFIQDHPLEMIGVHCTHGFNRTGFLIVSYMVEKMDCALEAALLAFAQARPPGIYKADYIAELYRLFEPCETPMPAPERPSWCFENPEYDDGEDEVEPTPSTSQKRPHENGNSKDNANGNAGKESNGGKKRRKEYQNMNATFMAGVTGVELVTDQPRLGQLQETVQKMCNWRSNGFPGSQPISMDMRNIALLSQKPYRVSWKADGTRYMMLIQKEGEVFFFDRDNSVFQVDGMRFPLLSNPQEHLVNTLIDGEMVIDKENGKSIPRYLVYDIVRFMGENYMPQTFDRRLDCIRKQVCEGRDNAFKHGMLDKRREPFGLRRKEFWGVEIARKLVEPKFVNSLTHEPDGLIFQPALDPYVPGRCDEVLKWKPAELNSVDFKLKISQDSGAGIVQRKVALLYVGGLDKPFSQMKYNKRLMDFDGKIIECKYENNSWVMMRERTDKSFPNSLTTAQAVCASIKCPVTNEYLFDFIESSRFREIRN